MINDFLKQSAIYGIGKIIAIIIGFLTLPIITKTLSPTDYGVFDLLNLCLILLNLCVALEISQALARFIGELKTKHEKKLYVSTAYFFSCIMYGIISVPLILFRDPLSEFIFNDPKYAHLFLYLIPWLFLHGTFLFLSNQFRWENMPRQHTVLQIFFAMALLGSVSFFLLFQFASLEYLIIAYLIALIFSVVMAFINAVRHDLIGISFSLPKLKTMLLFSSPLVLSSIAVFSQNYIDRIMISQFLNLSNLGIYAVAFKIVSLLTVFAGIFQLSAVPLIYKHYSDRDAAQDFGKSANLYLFAILICIIGLGFFAPELFHIFIGKEFHSALPLIPILLISAAFQSFYTFAPGLSISKKTSLIAVINICGMGLNIILNIIFIQIMGLIGVAIATMIAAMVTCIAHVYISQKHFKIAYHYKSIMYSLCLIFIALYGVSITYDWNFSFFVIALKIGIAMMLTITLAIILLPDEIKNKIISQRFL